MIKKIIKALLEKRLNKGSNYKLPFNELIDRCLSRVPKIPFCPICYLTDKLYIPMKFRRSHIAGGKGFPYRDDTAFKCVECYHTLHIGVPISKKTALKEIELRGGSPYLSSPSFRVDEREKEEIRKRLLHLGYFDFGNRY